MSSHIDCVIPKEKDYSVSEIKEKLKNVFLRREADFKHIERYGKNTQHTNGEWWVKYIPSKNNEPEYITGEGDGFSINFYKKTIHISNPERFSSLYDTDHGISQSLFRILTEISNEFQSTDKILIGAGGFGATDPILDMAYYDGADFELICEKMMELNGIPANSLTELKDKSWYLKK